MSRKVEAVVKLRNAIMGLGWSETPFKKDYRGVAETKAGEWVIKILPQGVSMDEFPITHGALFKNVTAETKERILFDGVAVLIRNAWARWRFIVPDCDAPTNPYELRMICDAYSQWITNVDEVAEMWEKMFEREV